MDPAVQLLRWQLFVGHMSTEYTEEDAKSMPKSSALDCNTNKFLFKHMLHPLTHKAILIFVFVIAISNHFQGFNLLHSLMFYF